MLTYSTVCVCAQVANIEKVGKQGSYPVVACMIQIGPSHAKHSTVLFKLGERRGCSGQGMAAMTISAVRLQHNDSEAHCK